MRFADDLSWVAPRDDSSGAALRFVAEATRKRRENYLLVRSHYEQPFGTFTGTVPGAGELRVGWGVMERHEVFW